MTRFPCFASLRDIYKFDVILHVGSKCAILWLANCMFGDSIFAAALLFQLSSFHFQRARSVRVRSRESRICESGCEGRRRRRQHASYCCCCCCCFWIRSLDPSSSACKLRLLRDDDDDVIQQRSCCPSSNIDESERLSLGELLLLLLPDQLLGCPTHLHSRLASC